MVKSLIVAVVVMCLAAVALSSSAKGMRSVSILKKVRSAKPDKFSFVYIMADLNKDGNLDKAELKNLAVNMVGLSESEADEFVELTSLVDINGDGKLSKEEFQIILGKAEEGGR